MRIFGNSDSKQVEIQIEDEDRPTTCEDIQLILPTVLIILVTLVIMTTVIPYAFHVVINQLKSHYAEEESMHYLCISLEASCKLNFFQTVIA